MKPIIMTSSGTRAIIGENFHPNIATNTAMAFGYFLGKGPVIVGGDTRVSYDMIKNAVISGLIAVGIDVIDIGQCLTPTLQQMIGHHKASGGIMITASHNPIQWNGLKLMNATGSFLEPDEYDAFRNLYDGAESPRLADWPNLGQVRRDRDAVGRHVGLVLSNIDTNPIKSSTLRVCVDANNGAGAIANPLLLDQLGVTYKILNPEPNGRFAHNPEPLKGNLTQLLDEMKTGNYDIGFAQDADADRLVIVDENGRFIGEDYSLAFCVDYILSKSDDPTKKVVVNLSTSNVLNFIAQKHNASLTQTKIGETNVTKGLRDQNATVGGEGNGGVIFPKVGWGRDSLVGITIALNHLAETNRSVSDIVSEYPQFVMLRDKFEVSSREEVNRFLDQVELMYQGEKIDSQDGRKVMLADAWIHCRPSNTEPIVRIFVEAPSASRAQELLDKTRSILTVQTSIGNH